MGGGVAQGGHARGFADVQQCLGGNQRGTTMSYEEGAYAEQGGQGQSGRKVAREGDVSGPGVSDSYEAPSSLRLVAGFRTTGRVCGSMGYSVG